MGVDESSGAVNTRHGRPPPRLKQISRLVISQLISHSLHASADDVSAAAHERVKCALPEAPPIH